MKTPKRYTETFRLQVIREYFSTQCTQNSLEKKYGIGHGALSHWLKQRRLPTVGIGAVTLPLKIDMPAVTTTEPAVLTVTLPMPATENIGQALRLPMPTTHKDPEHNVNNIHWVQVTSYACPICSSTFENKTNFCPNCGQDLH